jgi:hypothetical protein
VRIWLREAALGGPLEDNPNTVRLLVDSNYAVAEYRLTTAFDGTVDQTGQVTATDADVALTRQPAEDTGIEPTDAPALSVDNTQLLDVIALAPQARNEPHPLGDIEAGAQKSMT